MPLRSYWVSRRPLEGERFQAAFVSDNVTKKFADPIGEFHLGHLSLVLSSWVQWPCVHTLNAPYS